MTTKNQKTFLVAVFIILSVFVLLKYGFNTLSLTPQGFATLGITQANLQSSSQFFNGQQWVVTVVQNQLAQSLTGTFTPNNIQSLTPGEQTTQNNLQISINYQDQSCEYPIFGTNQVEPVKRASLATWACTGQPTQSSAQAHAQGPVLYYGATSLLFQCFAIYSPGQSPIGAFETPQINNKFDVHVNTGSQSATQHFETLQGLIGGPIGDFAYAQWVGNLNSGTECPSSDTYKPAYVDGNWRIVNAQAVELAVQHQNTNPSIIGLLTTSDLNSWINQQNNLYNNAIISQPVSNSQLNGAGSLSNAIWKRMLQAPIQFPVVNLYIRASTLGIFTPIPDIRILSASSQCFPTGEQGIISVELNNQGTQSGGASLSISCPSPFQATGATQQVNIAAGQTQTINIPLSASVAEHQTASCTATITNTGGQSYSTQASVCSDPLITCTVPYPQRFCGLSNGAEVVKQCSQNGATQNIIETCNSGETCEDGECISQSSGTTTPSTPTGECSKIFGFIPNVPCLVKKAFQGVFDFLYTIKLTIIFAVTTISIFVTETALRNLRSFKRRKAARWLISLGISAGLGITLYQFLGGAVFWGIVVGSFIYLFFADKIIKIFKK